MLGKLLLLQGTSAAAQEASLAPAARLPITGGTLPSAVPVAGAADATPTAYAAPLLEKAVRSCTRFLGSLHPHTLHAKMNLANVKRRRGEGDAFEAALLGTEDAEAVL